MVKINSLFIIALALVALNPASSMPLNKRGGTPDENSVSVVAGGVSTSVRTDPDGAPQGTGNVGITNPAAGVTVTVDKNKTPPGNVVGSGALAPVNSGGSTGAASGASGILSNPASGAAKPASVPATPKTGLTTDGAQQDTTANTSTIKEKAGTAKDTTGLTTGGTQQDTTTNSGSAKDQATSTAGTTQGNAAGTAGTTQKNAGDTTETTSKDTGDKTGAAITNTGGKAANGIKNPPTVSAPAASAPTVPAQ